MPVNRDSCLFCRIYDGREDNAILYKDDQFAVFCDIRPAARHHYLVITKEHIQNVKNIPVEQSNIVDTMVQIGKQVLEERGGDLSDVRFGFHWPPFCSISHIHLHVISPTSDSSFISRLIFHPNSWWFVTPDYVKTWLASKQR